MASGLDATTAGATATATFAGKGLAEAYRCTPLGWEHEPTKRQVSRELYVMGCELQRLGGLRPEEDLSKLLSGVVRAAMQSGVTPSMTLSDMRGRVRGEQSRERRPDEEAGPSKRMSPKRD